MKSSIYLRSPAKINLFFRVLGRRDDKFHNIASLYQAIDLCDEMILEKSQATFFQCNVPLQWNNDNFIWRALEIFQSKLRKNFHVSIKLNKKIPIEAGLGGGSSNAASCLWGLNELFDRIFTLKQLQEMAQKISADVSFFLSSGSAYCTGRGEIIKNCGYDKTALSNLIIAKPNFGMSTQLVYQNVDLQKISCEDPKQLLENFKKGDPIFLNDLEKVALSMDGRLKGIKDQLLAFGYNKVFLTGSGSSFVCIGKEDFPNIKNVSFYKTTPLQRDNNSWY